MSGPRRGSVRTLAARAAFRMHPARPARVWPLLRESERRAPEELRELQLAQLRAVLAAASRIPFHRSRLDAAGLSPDGLRSLDDLAGLPPLEREDLQRLGVDGLSVAGARGRRRGTSGSTGKPVEVLWPSESIAWHEATTRRFDGWLGAAPGERRVLVTNALFDRTLRVRATHRLLNATLFPVRLLDDRAAIRALARSLARRPAAIVAGVSNGLYLLARALQEEGLEVRAGGCWSGGDHLQPGYRPAIEAALGCPLHERYRAIEVGAIAHECPEGRRFHLCAETVVVEIVRGDGLPAAPGETGEVLVTTLRNQAMPLLRYRIGDLAVAPAEDAPCPCGRTLPPLGRLIGRRNELLRAADGRLLVPELVSRLFAEHAGDVLEFRVLQGEDLRVVARVVQRETPGASAERRLLAAELEALLGLPGRVTVERVAALPVDDAGKHARVRSLATRGGDAVVHAAG